MAPWDPVRGCPGACWHPPLPHCLGGYLWRAAGLGAASPRALACLHAASGAGWVTQTGGGHYLGPFR